MKDFKLRLDDSLWERFYRAYPDHGERSRILRKIIRKLIMLKDSEKTLEDIVAEKTLKEL